MGRRGKSEGSIYQRSDGRWAAAIDSGFIDGRRVRKTFYGVTRAYVAQILQTALQGEVVSQILEGQRRFDLLVRLEETYRTESRRILAASLAQLGELDEARTEAELFMMSNPHFTISHWAAHQPFRDEAMREHFVDGYRKAGLPER